MNNHDNKLLKVHKKFFVKKFYYYYINILKNLINFINLEKGIWLSEARERPMIIMDVEGTDGRERGEEQVNIKKLILHKL